MGGGGGGGVPPISVRIFANHVLIFSLSPMQHLRWSFVTKIGNSWKLLLTIVTESFLLNVAGLLSSGIYMFKFNKKINQKLVKYIQS